MNDLSDAFQIDKSIHFLNHGSYGATPKEVFDDYVGWQRRLELQPVKFLARDVPALFKEVRNKLANYLGTDGNNLVLVPNATFGVNVIARSLKLSAGDEVLSSDLEYGACDNLWSYLAERQGFIYKQQSVKLPVVSKEAFVADFWSGVTDKTKVIYLSHITSQTALILPIAEICAKAKEAGILTVIDGAHAPGQIPLHLDTLGADFYTANCHKWMCAPKGSAFLYVSEKLQDNIDPLIVGWGMTKTRGSAGSDFLDAYEWLGTNDPAAYLSIPKAIEFQAKHDWDAVRDSCHQRVMKTINRIDRLTGLDSFYGNDSQYKQLAVALLPKSVDSIRLKSQLYDDYKVEIPLTAYQDQPFIRISIQAYNTEEDTDALLNALGKLL